MSQPRRLVAAAVGVLAIAGTAAAEPTEPPPPPPPPPPPAESSPPPAEHTAATVEGAPRPGDESGRLDVAGPDSTLRRVGRGALALPRGLFSLVLAPVRHGVWAFERYQVYERTRQLLFNDAGTFGVVPTVMFDSDFGVSVGARVIADLGDSERVRLRAATGGRYRQIVSGVLRGEHLGDRLSYELRGEYERRPKELFSGLGNADQVTAMTLPPGTLIDALSDDTAIATRYRQQLARGALSAGLRAVGDLHVRAAAAVGELELAASETAPPITEVYQPGSLIGFDGYRHLYGELELTWDSRRPAHAWESRSLHAAGWLVSAFAGRVGLAERPDFWRYGGDVQRFLRLGRGPRVIALRVHGEGVSGARTEVPFIELPAIGGSSVLRGYPTERFRDRIAAFGSAEYEWDLAHTLFASVFVDAGRVFPSLDALSLDGLRCGYGFALELHGETSFWLRASVASSIDGGLFVNVSLDPVFEIDPRAVRR